MVWVLHLLLFFIGLAVGSFLNVLIDRIPAGKSIGGRSVCDYCGVALPAKDLIPVVSFFIQRGRSSCCHKSLSWQYPLVEVLTGGAFAFVGWKAGIVQVFFRQVSSAPVDIWRGTVGVVFYLFIISALIVLIFTDIKYYLLPDGIVLPSIAVAFVYRVYLAWGKLFHLYQGLVAEGNFVGRSLLFETNFFWGRVWLQVKDFVFTLEGSLILALVFLLLIIVTKGKGMGLGDLKLAILIGLVCGWPTMMVAMFIGFVLGSIVSLILIAFRTKSFGDRVPLGPFLAMGTFISMFYGEELLNLYYRLFV